jgi:hypothetical protein
MPGAAHTERHPMPRTLREYEYETQLWAMDPPGRMRGPLRRYVIATTPAGHVHVVTMPTAARHHITHTRDGRRWLIVRRWWGRVALRMPVGQWETAVSQTHRAGGWRFLLPHAVDRMRG